jgi:adenylyltransferase/sulfurtransferase
MSTFQKFHAKAYQLVHGAANEPSMTVEELKSLLDAGDDVFVLDVREQQEWDIAHIKGAKLIPLMQLPEKFKELDPKKPTVVLCHVGGRSARAVAFLRKNGFQKAFNLEGGIVAWAEKIDPSLPQY